MKSTLKEIKELVKHISHKVLRLETELSKIEDPQKLLVIEERIKSREDKL